MSFNTFNVLLSIICLLYVLILISFVIKDDHISRLTLHFYCAPTRWRQRVTNGCNFILVHQGDKHPILIQLLQCPGMTSRWRQHSKTLFPSQNFGLQQPVSLYGIHPDN